MILKFFFTWVGFVVVSWIMLFRQEGTIGVIGKFYPSLGNNLFMVRRLLLGLGLNSTFTLIFTLIIILLFYIYWRLLEAGISTRKSLFLTIGAQVLVLLSYPFLSTDIFDYILTGRLGMIYHQNIWISTPSAFPNDPFYQLGSWQHMVSPYGATNQLIYSLPAAISGNDPAINILLYKLLVFVFVVGSIILSLKTLKTLRLNVPQGILIVFANPLFIIETAGSAHNIIVTIFFLLAIVYSVLQGRWLIAGIVSGLAIHTKFVPVILASLEAINLIRVRKWENFTKFIIPLSIVVWGLFLISGTDVILYLGQILIGRPIYWQSLPQLVHKFYPFEGAIFLVSFLAICSQQTLRLLWGKTTPVEVSAKLLFIYLLFFVSFYLNWYVLWLLIFVPLIKSRVLSVGILFLTLSSALIYPLYMISLRFDYKNPIWPFLIYFLLIGIPLGAIAYEKNLKKIST